MDILVQVDADIFARGDKKVSTDRFGIPMHHQRHFPAESECALENAQQIRIAPGDMDVTAADADSGAQRCNLHSSGVTAGALGSAAAEYSATVGLCNAVVRAWKSPLRAAR
jgi:hypothetical protein